jgi:hypothetical protein
LPHANGVRRELFREACRATETTRAIRAGETPSGDGAPEGGKPPAPPERSGRPALDSLSWTIEVLAYLVKPASSLWGTVYPVGPQPPVIGVKLIGLL